MRFSHAFLSFCISTTGVALAADKPANALPKKVAARAISDDSGHRAASETAAAIDALGEKPTNRQVSNVVFEAVRKSPENVLSIVDAAVRVSPQSAAPAIVTAATAAVPDPWKQVTYHRINTHVGKKGARDFKGGPDGKDVVNLDGHTPGRGTGTSDPRGTGSAAPGGSGVGNTSGNTVAGRGASGGGMAGDSLSVTLAEAIARTAFDAQPGLSFPDLQSAVEVALNTDPATLLRYVQSSRSISSVGDAGSSNFANEPVRPRTLGGNGAVPAPNPPVVSR